MVNITILLCTMILVTAECATVRTIDPLKTLKMVHVLFRHGDRAPIQLYPNDPNKYISSKIWPEGFGQLTKIGKQMAYDLGLYLRNRYDGFIKRVFDTEEVQVRSTDYDRTLMTAQCVMAAFYRPDDETKFIEGLNWVPTPIHSVPGEDDNLLGFDADCPRAASEFSKLDEIPEIQDVIEKNEELFKFVSEKSGANVTSLIDALLFFNTLQIERLYNLTIPYWAMKIYTELNILYNFGFELFSYTHELMRLRGGPLIKEITENMINKSRSDLSERNMYVYSAHDATVSVLLDTMGVYNGIPPPYSATVMVELHQTGRDYFVKIYYQNDTNFENPPHELTIPGCSFACPLQDWRELLMDVIPEDWEKECQDTDPVQNHSSANAYGSAAKVNGIQTKIRMATLLKEID